VIAWNLIPLIWFLPVGITETFVGGSTSYRNDFLIWAWGWQSRAEGWFGLDPYTEIGEMQQYKMQALLYAIFLTILLACQGYAAKKGHRPGMLGIILIFTAIYYFFASSGGTCLVMSVTCSFTQVFPVLGIVFGSAAVKFCCFYKLHVPLPKEQNLYHDAAVLVSKADWEMQAQGSDEMDRGKIDDLQFDLNWIGAHARLVGVNVHDELKFGRKMLANLNARYIMRETLRHDGVISIDKLRAVSGLPTEQFLTLLLDICRQLNLSTDGNVVTAKNDQDTASFLQEIEGYFSKWREVEASKLGKV
jgi:hypothetical protein